MSLSREALLYMEARNEKRRVLRADVSKGPWGYESFAWIEADTTPYKEQSCILVRRRSWFHNLWQNYGTGILDEATAEGTRKYALQPAYDGLYVKAVLNDPIEDDIAKLLAEVRRLSGDPPPVTGDAEATRRQRVKRANE